MTEHPQNSEDRAADQPPGGADAALPATEANAPGPGDVPADPAVNPVEPEAAPTVVETPSPQAGPAPTVVGAPSPLAADPPSPEPIGERAPSPPPPLPPPPAPPRVTFDSGPGTSSAERPEIPVAAAFAGGFLLAMILRRFAR